jgi:hypothetical protein
MEIELRVDLEAFLKSLVLAIVPCHPQDNIVVTRFVLKFLYSQFLLNIEVYLMS